MDDMGTLDVVLPRQLAAIVRTKVASGAYRTPGDVLADGLQLLLQRDKALETGCREPVIGARDTARLNRSRGLYVDTVRARIAALEDKGTSKR